MKKGGNKGFYSAGAIMSGKSKGVPYGTPSLFP